MKKTNVLVAIFVIALLAGCSGGGGAPQGLEGYKDITEGFKEGITPQNIAGSYQITGQIQQNTCGTTVQISDPTSPTTLTITQSSATMSISSYGGSAPAPQVPTNDTNKPGEDLPESEGGASIDTASAIKKTTPGSIPSGLNDGVVSDNKFKIETEWTNDDDKCSESARYAVVGTIDGNDISGYIQEVLTSAGECEQPTKQAINCYATISFGGTKTTSSSSSGGETAPTPAPQSSVDELSNKGGKALFIKDLSFPKTNK